MFRSTLAAGGMIAAAIFASTALPAQRPMLKNDQALRDGGISQPPGGWLDFCARMASDPACRPARKLDLGSATPVLLDDARWAEVERIHAELAEIRQTTERSEEDHWVVARSSGDCEDIALAGREKLLAAGFPRRAVRLATASTEAGDQHVVVTLDGIRDGKRDTWVLDNRSAQVTSWRTLKDSGYHFETRQAASGPYWVAVRAPNGSPLS